MAITIERLILEMYEAAVEPAHWTEVLAGLSELTGGASVYLCHVPLTDPRGGFTWTHEFDPSALAVYKRHYAGPQYAGVRAVLASPVGKVLDRREVTDDRDFVADPGHQAFLLSQGLFHGLMSPVHRDARSFSALLCMRDRRRGAIEHQGRRAVEQLLPHLTQAIRIQQRICALSDQSTALSGALDSLSVGVISVDASLRVCFCNAEAARVLALDDGLSCLGGRLVASVSAQQNALSTAVTLAAKDDPQSLAPHVFVRRPSGAADLALMVVPLRASPHSVDQRSGARATIYLTDPAGTAHLPTAEVLAARFGLTATEAEVARLTATGQGTPYVARTMRISINTARTHLKALYSKMGVNAQSQLARLVIESFPPVLDRNG